MNQKDRNDAGSGLARSSLPARLPKTRWFHKLSFPSSLWPYTCNPPLLWGCSVKTTAFWLCLVGVCIPLLASGQRSHSAASDKSVALVDAVLLPGESLIWPIRAALIQNYTTCTNCLIRRCLVVGGKLNGYCLTGARGGICHESYDPIHCPAGKLPKAPVKRQCGPSVSVFTVDNLRACQ